MTEQINLEQVCRTYSLVEFRDIPYNTKLAKVKSILDKIYSKWINEDKLESSRTQLVKLEQLVTKSNDESKNILEKLKGTFSNGKQNNFTGRAQELGSKLEEADKTLTNLEEELRSAYNSQISTIYHISQNVRIVKQI